MFSIDTKGPEPTGFATLLGLRPKLCYATSQQRTLPLSELERHSGSGFVLVCRPILQPHHLIGLGSFAALNNVELYLIPFLQTLISVGLDGTVMHEYVRSAFTSQKAVAFCIVEPFDCAFVLRHLNSPLRVWLGPDNAGL